MSIKYGSSLLAGMPDVEKLLDSTSFTGTPTVPTATVGDNSKQIANTEFVQNAISNFSTSGAYKVGTRNWTYEQWKQYASTNVSTSYNPNFDVEGIKVGDIGYVYGTVSDRNNIQALMIGIVTNIDNYPTSINIQSLGLSIQNMDLIDSIMSNYTETTVDNTSISYNDDNNLQVNGVVERNKGIVNYDWVGTLSEYQEQDIENQHPEWICYITDDNDFDNDVSAKEVFIATYNTTTYSEISAAYNAGKVCYCKFGEYLFPLVQITTSVIRFINLLNGMYATRVVVTSDNVWSSATISLNVSGQAANQVLITNDSGYGTTSSVTATELSHLSGISSNVQTQLDEISKNHLTTNQITNCITEIPQDIKLELVDGTLTLKAGSKVYDANGNIININNDLSIGNYGSASTQLGICVNSSGTELVAEVWSYSVSGTTAPTSGFIYNTDTNVISRYSDSTETHTNLSFPICSVSRNSGTITSIDQVFNGFGYIGSTVFALPGVKGLIPNGRNADGTLRNIEYVSQNVITRTFASSYSISDCLLLFSPNRPNYSFSVIYPEGVVTQGYDIKINNFKSDLFTSMAISIGSISLDSGKITSVILKTTFQAVDRNDTSWLSGLGAPSNRYIDLTLGANGATYIAPASGYYYTRLVGTSGNYFYLRNRSASNIADGGTLGSRGTDVSVRVKKGDEVYLVYNGTISTVEVFRFIYTEGEIE